MRLGTTHIARMEAVSHEIQWVQLRALAAPFQHPRVSRAYHEKVYHDLEEAAPAYDDVWRIHSAPFPYIQIQLIGTDKEPVLGLFLNLENYPHRAMSIHLSDASCRQFSNRAYFKPGDTGRQGVYLNQQTQRFWFCTPGTDEYHGRYSDEEPFDRVRGTPEVEPLEVILRCIRFLDLTAATRDLRTSTNAPAGGKPI